MVDLHDGDEGEEDDRYHEPGHDWMHAAALHGNIYIAIRFGERNMFYLQENILNLDGHNHLFTSHICIYIYTKEREGIY